MCYFKTTNINHKTQKFTFQTQETVLSLKTDWGWSICRLSGGISSGILVTSNLGLFSIVDNLLLTCNLTKFFNICQKSAKKKLMCFVFKNLLFWREISKGFSNPSRCCLIQNLIQILYQFPIQNCQVLVRVIV